MSVDGAIAVLAGRQHGHRAAAAHRGIVSAGAGRIDVTTPRGQHPRRGIRFHRSSAGPGLYARQ
jgi:hypothetical protein